MVHTGSGLADAERTKSGIELTLASDGEYELASDRFFFEGRRSIDNSLGTRFNDIFGCSEKGTGRAESARRGSDDRSTGGPEELAIVPWVVVLLGSDGGLPKSLLCNLEIRPILRVENALDSAEPPEGLSDTD